MANTTYGPITVTTSATEIVVPASNKKGLFLVNNSAVTVFVGPDSSITTSNAIPLYARSVLSFGGKDQAWKGSIYGIVASGTADTRFWYWGEA